MVADSTDGGTDTGGQTLVSLLGASVSVQQGEVASKQSVGTLPAPLVTNTSNIVGLQVAKTAPEFAEAMMGVVPSQYRSSWSAAHIYLLELSQENAELKRETTTLRQQLDDAKGEIHRVDKERIRLEERQDGGFGKAFGAFALNSLGSVLTAIAAFTPKSALTNAVFTIGVVMVVIAAAASLFKGGERA